MSKTFNGNQKHQFCTFRISEYLFGVNILDVKEVNAEVEFTPIFHAPKQVKGYVNIRGQIHLILDLRLLLGFEPKAVNEESRVILFKSDPAESFGILADQIGDVVDVDETRIEYHSKKTEDIQEIPEQNISKIRVGICKLQDELLVILDAYGLLRRIEKNIISNP